MPLGLWLVGVAPGEVVKGVLGVMLVAYGTQSLLGVVLPRLKWGGWVWVAGIVSGGLAAAYNFSGPPVVLYGVMSGWRPEKFRAILQGLFVPLGGVVLAGQVVSGEYWSWETAGLTLCAAPGVWCGMRLGRWALTKIDPIQFRKALDVVLIVLGVMLVW